MIYGNDATVDVWIPVSVGRVLVVFHTSVVGLWSRSVPFDIGVGPSKLIHHSPSTIEYPPVWTTWVEYHSSQCSYIQYTNTVVYSRAPEIGIWDVMPDAINYARAPMVLCVSVLLCSSFSIRYDSPTPTATPSHR